jgi:hypothetical protein
VIYSYASIYALGVLVTFRLASLFKKLFSPRSVSAACIYYISIYMPAQGGTANAVLETCMLGFLKVLHHPLASLSGLSHAWI